MNYLQVLCINEVHKASHCRTSFTILTALFIVGGRRLVEVECANNSQLLTEDTIFPNSKYGFNGRRFIVSTNYVSNNQLAPFLFLL